MEQLNCLNRAVEYVQMTQDLETRFMAAVRRLKQAYNLCNSAENFTDAEIEKVHFYQAVRSVLFKLTKGDAPDTSQMNAKVRQLLEGAIQSDGIEELFETGKHIDVDLFSDEYMARAVFSALVTRDFKMEKVFYPLAETANSFHNRVEPLFDSILVNVNEILELNHLSQVLLSRLSSR